MTSSTLADKIVSSFRLLPPPPPPEVLLTKGQRPQQRSQEKDEPTQPTPTDNMGADPSISNPFGKGSWAACDINFDIVFLH